jgi:hypothetical protein
MILTRMSAALSDLVLDSKLQAEVFDDHTLQTNYISNPSIGERRVRVEEKWQRTKRLGSGSYGVVWLEKCLSGPNPGQLRAVKELSKNASHGSTLDYRRELEAIAKFSQERVGSINRPIAPAPNADMRIISIEIVLSARMAGSRTVAPFSLQWSTCSWVTWRSTFVSRFPRSMFATCCNSC